MKKLFIGPCPLCSEIIWNYRKLPFILISKDGIKVNFKRSIPYEQNEKGALFWVLQTDSSRMQIAICKKCLETLTDEQVRQIFADVIYTKLEAIKDDSRKHLHYKLFDRIRTIEVFTWKRTEQEIIEYLGQKYNPQVINK